MTFDYLFKKNNCASQLAELAKRTDEGVPILRRSLMTRCQSIHPAAQWQNHFAESFACPCRNQHPLAAMLLQAASALKVGVLPYSGGLLEQPAILMELIQMAQSFLQDYELRVMKEEQGKKPGGKR
jgi:hypothetical protein